MKFFRFYCVNNERKRKQRKNLMHPMIKKAISCSEDKPKKSSEDKLSPNRIEKQLTRLMAMKSSLENFLPEELLEDIETLEMFEGLTSHLDTSKRCKLSSKVTRMIELTLPRFEIQKQELLKQSSLKKN